MVRFLKSSSMTDQSHPWDSSISCDSSSRATTKTKTNRTNVAPLFDRITAAEEASKSILFPNGEGGSSNTTTNTPTTTNNNTDITKALHDDMSIPKLTAVRAASELRVEDSSPSTIVDDCASDSVASLYHQMMQTLEQTDKVLTKDIPIAVSTTLHHTHKRIRDSLNESINSGLGMLLDKDRTDFINYDPDCVSSTQLDQLKKTIPSQSFLVGACLPRGTYLPTDIALMRQSSLQEIKRQSSKSIPSYKPSQKVSTSNQHPTKTNTMTKLPSQNYEISPNDEDVQHNATQNLLTLISKTFDFTGEDDDLSVQQKEMVEQEMKKMEEMEEIWPMIEEEEEGQEEEGHEHGYVRRGSFITPPIVNSTIDNDNDNDSDSDSDNDETIHSYYAMTLSSQSLLKRSSSPKGRTGKSKRKRNKNREQKKKSLFQNIDTFLSNKKKKEKQRRRRKLPSFVSSFWTTSAGPKEHQRTVASSSKKQEQEQRGVDVDVNDDGNNSARHNIDEERDENTVLEVAEISSLPSSESSASAISALSYLEDDNDEERGITFVYHNDSDSDHDNEKERSSSYVGDSANTDAVVDKNTENKEGEGGREFEGDNSVDREIKWGDPGLELYAYNNDEEDDDVEERDDVAVESSSVSSTFVAEDGGGVDKKKGGTRGTGGGGSSALVSSTFVAEDDVDKKKGGTSGTRGGGSSALVYDQDHNDTKDDSEEVVTIDVGSESDTESTKSVEQNSVEQGEDFARYGIENRSVNQIRKIQYRI